MSEANYQYYGGRGITVCPQWSVSFPAFLKDMGPCRDGFELDRVDSDGNYEPANCRWVSRIEQMRNIRRNHLLTHAGETLTLSEWTERTGVTHGTIIKRLRLGWPISAALSNRDGRITRGRNLN